MGSRRFMWRNSAITFIPALLLLKYKRLGHRKNTHCSGALRLSKLYKSLSALMKRSKLVGIRNQYARLNKSNFCLLALPKSAWVFPSLWPFSYLQEHLKVPCMWNWLSTQHLFIHLYNYFAKLKISSFSLSPPPPPQPYSMWLWHWKWSGSSASPWPSASSTSTPLRFTPLCSGTSAWECAPQLHALAVSQLLMSST